MKGHLYIVAGCSGVGKGTLLKLFLKENPEIKLSISDTTIPLQLSFRCFLLFPPPALENTHDALLPNVVKPSMDRRPSENSHPETNGILSESRLPQNCIHRVRTIPGYICARHSVSFSTQRTAFPQESTMTGCL